LQLDTCHDFTLNNIRWKVCMLKGIHVGHMNEAHGLVLDNVRQRVDTLNGAHREAYRLVLYGVGWKVCVLSEMCGG